MNALMKVAAGGKVRELQTAGYNQKKGKVLARFTDVGGKVKSEYFTRYLRNEMEGGIGLPPVRPSDGPAKFFKALEMRYHMSSTVMVVKK